jgi:hypothetical protein
MFSAAISSRGSPPSGGVGGRPVMIMMLVPDAVTGLDLGSVIRYPGISTPGSNYVSTRLSLSFVLRSPTICFSVT